MYLPKTIFFVLALFLFGSAAEKTSGRYEPVTKFDPQRDATKDIAEAVKEAQQTGKRVLLDVGGEWCSWCHKLDKFFEDNEDVRQFLDTHFIMVKINYSKENKNEAVLSKYPKIPGYPHYFVLESDGTFLHSQNTAELEKGKGYDKNKIFAFLKKWAK